MERRREREAISRAVVGLVRILDCNSSSPKRVVKNYFFNIFSQAMPGGSVVVLIFFKSTLKSDCNKCCISTALVEER